MPVAFIKIRFKQIFRAIIEIGSLRIIFIIGLLAFFGIYVFLQTTDPRHSYYVVGFTVVFLAFIHTKRKDKLFLKSHFNEFRLILFVEYVLLTSPILFFLIWNFQFIPFVTLLFTTGIVVFIDLKPVHRNLNTSLQKLIPDSCFEWKSGIRKTLFLTVFLWLAALATSFFIGSVPVAIFILGIISLSYYENAESLQMLLVYEKNANQFLFQKIKMQIVLFSIIILPLILAFIIFYAASWYIPVAEYLIFNFLFVYTIFTKYAFYQPNRQSSAAQTFSAIGAVCGIVPLLLPVVWLLSVRFYFKSLENLNIYLDDYN